MIILNSAISNFDHASCFSECNQIYLLFNIFYFSCRDHILNFLTSRQQSRALHLSYTHAC